MQNQKDNYLSVDENSSFKLVVLSVIGDREEQQDSAGYELKNNEGIIAVCDGMGGMDGGKTASTIAVDNMMKVYLDEYPCNDFHSLLVDAVVMIDQKISSLKNADGLPLRGGSTAVSVVIKEKKLFWVSVGDSRIYLFRDGEFVRVTNDHIYRYVLEQKYDDGEISAKEYFKEMEKGEALVSFLGVGGLPYIDSNDKPFELESGDRILLMSDGLYKILSDFEIFNIIRNFNNLEESVNALEYKTGKIAGKNSISRDNMTIALIEVK